MSSVEVSVLGLLNQGKTVNDVSYACGLSPWRVRTIARDNGLSLRKLMKKPAGMSRIMVLDSGPGRVDAGGDSNV